MFRACTIALLLAVVLSTIAATPAHAVQRTHVSAAIGVDTNTATGCTPVAPCRTFQAAMTVTNPNGEVIALDSGGYDNAINIRQSVSLIAPPGVYAGISALPNTAGITIFARSRINVVLRGLTIIGQGGFRGIDMSRASTLTVENCVISGHTSGGIDVSQDRLAPSDITVRISDTVIRDNGNTGVRIAENVNATITRATISGHSLAGIDVSAQRAGVAATADIADSTLDGNGIGIRVVAGSTTNSHAKVSIRDSRVVRNSNAGISTGTSMGSTVSLSASNNILSNNFNGIVASTVDTRIWASGNTVSDNTNFGLLNEGGALFESAGNNAVRNNGINKSGTITVISAE
jgi:Right handed beta helix region